MQAAEPAPGADAGMAAEHRDCLEAFRGSRQPDRACPVAVPGNGMRARRLNARRDGIDLPDSLLNDMRSLRAA